MKPLVLLHGIPLASGLLILKLAPNRLCKFSKSFPCGLNFLPIFSDDLLLKICVPASAACFELHIGPKHKLLWKYETRKQQALCSFEAHIKKLEVRVGHDASALEQDNTKARYRTALQRFHNFVCPRLGCLLCEVAVNERHKGHVLCDFRPIHRDEVVQDALRLVKLRDVQSRVRKRLDSPLVLCHLIDGELHTLLPYSHEEKARNNNHGQQDQKWHVISRRPQSRQKRGSGAEL
mmetsp:Transcript_1927/g.5783  ORF Transcript_1927/g.5783 Transcript_1927/m.5783 type:complete len:235 (+) Transcript_1927:282-986(+)